MPSGGIIDQVSLPADFLINDGTTPFAPDVFARLPDKQKRLERAIGGTRYVSRSLRALAKETGLSMASIKTYCEASGHITHSPISSGRGNDYFGYTVRLGEKYVISGDGEVGHLDLGKLAELGRQNPDVFISYAHADAGRTTPYRASIRGRTPTT